MKKLICLLTCLLLLTSCGTTVEPTVEVVPSPSEAAVSAEPTPTETEGPTPEPEPEPEPSVTPVQSRIIRTTTIEADPYPDHAPENGVWIQCIEAYGEGAAEIYSIRYYVWIEDDDNPENEYLEISPNGAWFATGDYIVVHARTVIEWNGDDVNYVTEAEDCVSIETDPEILINEADYDVTVYNRLEEWEKSMYATNFIVTYIYPE